ncbi:MAG: RNA polymerase sigma factor [Candidatus Doudnabacteria bacterium]|nr:RNA polymerase sigma factor [Candidatus Doudnabacteria bacterium]
MTEEELKSILQACQKGDKAAFGRLYDLYSERLYKFIYLRVGHKEIAEDILADSFVKVWTKISQVNSSKAFSSWIFQITKNNIIDYYRIRKSTIAIEEVEQTLEDASNPIEETELRLDQKRILVALSTLPRDQQQVIRYKFFEDLTNPEIALIMNKTEGAIRVIQHRAIVRLQEILRQKKV